MAAYLGLAMVVGYWLASQMTFRGEGVRDAEAASGITASTKIESSRYYANCTEARAAGAAPIYRGEPGYAPWLDRDDDGVACEPYYGPVRNFGRKTSERRHRSAY